MPKVQIMSVVGSAVPAPLRERGLLACWYLVQDGVTVSGPLIAALFMSCWALFVENTPRVQLP
jgi:hypothetical protein